MGERGPLGIIHPEVVAVESWFEPMKVGGYLTGDDIRLACVDVTMSHEMMIGLDGTFFSRRELSSSYFMWAEQSAFLWDFSMTRRGTGSSSPQTTRRCRRSSPRGWPDSGSTIFGPVRAGVWHGAIRCRDRG